MRAWWIAPMGLGLVLATAGCGDTQGQRATTGALGGVAFGAAVGGPIGAIVGGAAGAGVGAERGTIDRTVNTGTQKATAAVGLNRPENTANTASAATPGATNQASAGGQYGTGGRRASSEDMRDAQQRLTHLGLYKGPIDGRFGPQTAAALNDFQAENRLPRSGELTPETHQLLRSQTAQVPNNNQSGAANNEPNNQPGNQPNQPNNQPNEQTGAAPGTNNGTSMNPPPPNNPPANQPAR